MSFSVSNSISGFNHRSSDSSPASRCPIQCSEGNGTPRLKNESTGRPLRYGPSFRASQNLNTVTYTATEFPYCQRSENAQLIVPHSGCVQAFFASIEKNKFIEVKEQLQCYKIVNERNSYSETGLMVASALGFIGIVRLLVDNGADIDAEDSDGDTALVNAVLSKKPLEVTRYLLTKNASPNSESVQGKTCLHHIAGNASNNIQLIDLLLQFKADILFEPTVRQSYFRGQEFTTETPLQLMMQNRQFSAVKHFIKTQPKPFTFFNGICLGLLSESFESEFFSEDSLQFLLDTVISTKTSQVLKLLWKYSSSGETSLVKTLVNNGAEPQKMNENGNNALMLAAKSGQHESVIFLLDYVGVDCINDEGFDALGLAMNAYCLEDHKHIHRYKQCIYTLLEYGVTTQRFWDKDCSMTYADKLYSLFKDDETIKSLLISPKSTVELEPIADWFPSVFTLQAQAFKTIKREKLQNGVPSALKEKTQWIQDYI